MTDFTPTQARYLSFIHAYTEGLGVPPSETEIAEAMKVQPPSVHGMLKTMIKKGLNEKVPGKTRSIEILIDTNKIAPWKKKLRCDLKFWAPKDASKEMLDQIGERIVLQRIAERQKAKNNIAAKNSAPPETIYRFKITLRASKPPIWRRIETHDATIEQFHGLIQTGMGWTNSHMHEFEVAGTRFTHPRFLEHAFDDSDSQSYAGISISDWVAQHGTKLRINYMYDFGDSWDHEIILEGVFPTEPSVKYPRCVTGKLACPPEDIGGVFGFYDYVEAISNPKHRRHKEFIEWYGPFDPDSSAPLQTTKRMQQGLPKSS